MNTVYIIGDSTVETGAHPFYGWGGQLAQFLPRGDWAVVNRAIGGRSTKSFLAENRFDCVRSSMKADDLLLIGFGHNDEKDDALRHTDPFTTFQEMLMVYVNAAREVGAIPVLVTSTVRNYFVGTDTEYDLLYTHGEYPLAMRTLCAREHIALVDLKKRTRELLIGLGPIKSKERFVHLAPGEHPSYPDGHQDKTHFFQAGAQEIAAIVANELKLLGLTRGGSL